MADPIPSHTCPRCGRPPVLVTGRTIYPHRRDLAAVPFWYCAPCQAWAGCHPGTTKRKARLANAQTRVLRVAAHAAFDPIWKSGRLSRSAAYRWLRDATGIPERDCHIGWMDDDALRALPVICAEYMRTHHAA